MAGKRLLGMLCKKHILLKTRHWVGREDSENVRHPQCTFM
jgi:hypothetical protein